MANVARVVRGHGSGPVPSVGDWPLASERAPRVLVVEEDTALREVLENVLSDEGYDVTVVSAGVAALTALQASRTDAIVLDLMLPDMDGQTLAREYRRLPGPHAPIVALTTRPDTTLPRDGEDAGAEALVHMPFELDVLLDALRGAANTAGAAQRQHPS